MSLVRFAVFKVKLSRVPAVARNVNMIGVHNSCNLLRGRCTKSLRSGEEERQSSLIHRSE